MTILEIIDAFTFYGIDVILISVLCTLLVQVLKVTLFKKISKKIMTFLPFTVGTILYAAYAAARNLSIEYLLQEYIDVLEHGTSVGALSTLIYVLYEQFIRVKKSGLTATENLISTLIEGYVPTDRVEEVAKRVAEAIQKDVTGNGSKRAAEILKECGGEEINERDIQLLSRLIIETLAHVNC